MKHYATRLSEGRALHFGFETANKHSEVESKKSIIQDHLIPAFGRIRLDQIGHKEQESYKAKKLKAGLTGKTVNNQLTVLYSALREGKRRGLLDALPDRVWAKAGRPAFRFLEFEEAQHLIEASAPAWRLMVTVALSTGLQLGELLALRWQDVNLAQGQVNVSQAVAYDDTGTPKSNKPRTVPLPEDVKETLLLAREQKLGQLVFCGSSGSPVTKGACKWPLWKAGMTAGVGRIGWHVRRHTYASHLVMRGAPVAAVQELLGHSEIRVTMRYAHLSPGVTHSAAQLLHGTLMAHGEGSKKKSCDNR